MRDDLARHHGHLGLEGLEQAAVAHPVLPRDDEDAGLQPPRRHRHRQVGDVVVARGDEPLGLGDPGGGQRVVVRAEPVHDLEAGRGRLVGIDDGDVEAALAQRPRHLGAEAAVAADDPAAGRRRQPRAEPRAVRVGQPCQQPVGVGRAHRDRQPLGELAVGVDDLATPSRSPSPPSPRAWWRARSSASPGAAAAPPPRWRRSPGRRPSAPARRRIRGLARPASLSVSGEVTSPASAGGSVTKLAEVEVGDPRLVAIERHEPLPHPVERGRHHVAGLAEPAEQVEGLAQAPHRRARSAP